MGDPTFHGKVRLVKSGSISNFSDSWQVAVMRFSVFAWQNRRHFLYESGKFVRIAWAIFQFWIRRGCWKEAVKTHLYRASLHLKWIYSQIPVRRRRLYNCVYCFKLKFRHLLAGICEYFTLGRGYPTHVHISLWRYYSAATTNSKLNLLEIGTPKINVKLLVAFLYSEENNLIPRVERILETRLRKQ